MREIYLKKWHRLNKIMGFNVSLDGLLTAASSRPVIDIVRLDNKLIQMYDYTTSMKDCVVENYGKEAVELIEELL